MYELTYSFYHLWGARLAKLEGDQWVDFATASLWDQYINYSRLRDFWSNGQDLCCYKCHPQLVWVRTFGVMYGHTLSMLANHQIRHNATHKVSCQPGDCRWPFNLSLGVCVGMYGWSPPFIIPEDLISIEKVVNLWMCIVKTYDPCDGLIVHVLVNIASSTCICKPWESKCPACEIGLWLTWTWLFGLL